jgi:SIR2-like protein
MTVIDSPPSRDSVFDSLAFAAESGYLGLFAGSGFSKAATAGVAPSFGELLSRVATRLGLPADFDAAAEYRRKSLPQIASQLKKELARSGRPAPDQRFREAVADLCNLEPVPKIAATLSTSLRELGPAWVITTNYDLILEHLLEHAQSVLPTQPLVPNSTAPPIYHLHGHRYYPSTIRITEEDYVSLLAPIDYQRLKLPLLLLESTTLMLGYALGDINVRAAVEWSRSFRGERQLQLTHPQGTVVQALHSGSPADEPFFGPNGELVLEIASIPDFLSQLVYHRREIARTLENTREAITTFLSDPQNPLLLQTDSAKREYFLWIIKGSLPLAQPTQILEFLTNTLEPIWAKAREDYGFDYYNAYLELLLDVAEQLSLDRTNPKIVAFLGQSLDRVGWYFHTDRVTGYAWTASATWLAQHHRIPTPLKRELRSYAIEFDKQGLQRLLDHVKDPT